MRTHFDSQVNCAPVHSEAVNHAADGECLNFFAVAGMLHNAKEKQVLDLFVRAFRSNPDYALRTVFYARDICAGPQERRMFRLLIRRLAFLNAESVGRNMALFAEYGRFDDLMVLLDTPCEKEMAAQIAKQLEADLEGVRKGEMISLLGKWLPNPRAFSFEVRREAAKLACLLGMEVKRYGEVLEELQEHLRMIEWKLSRKEFSFRYEKLPGGKALRYRQRIDRNDPERYTRFVEEKRRQEGQSGHKGLFPCEIVKRCIDGRKLDERERARLNEAWRALPQADGAHGAVAVVDVSSSMYRTVGKDEMMPAAAAVGLGMYFAERGKGCFANRFIAVSKKPELIEVKGEDVVERARFCAGFDETAEIDLYEVFMLLLVAAVKNGIGAEDMPRSIYIITDTAFDIGVIPDCTVLEDAREKFEDYGYTLPGVVYWNMNSPRTQISLEISEKGMTMISGVSPSLLEMAMGQEVVPETLMRTVLESERYGSICA